MKWRMITDWAKRQPVALRLADWLGRGRGKFRFFDGLHRPSAPPKPHLNNWHKQDLAAVWIGHATILLRDHCIGVAPGQSFVMAARDDGPTDGRAVRSVRIALCGDPDSAEAGVKRLCEAAKGG